MLDYTPTETAFLALAKAWEDACSDARQNADLAAGYAEIARLTSVNLRDLYRAEARKADQRRAKAYRAMVRSRCELNRLTSQLWPTTL